MVRLSVKLCIFGIQNLTSSDSETARHLLKSCLAFIGVADFDSIEDECK